MVIPTPPSYHRTLDTARALSEGHLKRDPDARVHRYAPLPKTAPRRIVDYEAAFERERLAHFHVPIRHARP